MQGSVQDGDAVGDQDVRGVLRLGRLVEPTGCRLLEIEGRERPYRRRPGQRQGGWPASGLGLARSPPSPRRWGGGTQRLHHEHALLGVEPGQVAPVRQRQWAGEIELRESE
jgi:hypothetical protein